MDYLGPHKNKLGETVHLYAAFVQCPQTNSEPVTELLISLYEADEEKARLLLDQAMMADGSYELHCSSVKH